MYCCRLAITSNRVLLRGRGPAPLRMSHGLPMGSNWSAPQGSNFRWSHTCLAQGAQQQQWHGSRPLTAVGSIRQLLLQPAEKSQNQCCQSQHGPAECCLQTAGCCLLTDPVNAHMRRMGYVCLALALVVQWSVHQCPWVFHCPQAVTAVWEAVHT